MSVGAIMNRLLNIAFGSIFGKVLCSVIWIVWIVWMVVIQWWLIRFLLQRRRLMILLLLVFFSFFLEFFLFFFPFRHGKLVLFPFDLFGLDVRFSFFLCAVSPEFTQNFGHFRVLHIGIFQFDSTSSALRKMQKGRHGTLWSRGVFLSSLVRYLPGTHVGSLFGEVPFLVFRRYIVPIATIFGRQRFPHVCRSPGNLSDSCFISEFFLDFWLFGSEETDIAASESLGRLRCLSKRWCFSFLSFR